jgi:asparagine synthase (glutamine-hydrolysing)
MCGIAGLFHYKTRRPVDRGLLESMTSRLVHRGPDQSGLFTDADVGLGHRRLSIIDLSEAGRQPMTNEDGNVIVTFNGEIYNFQELRSELRGAGHVFRSSSDTEVLVHLWEDLGPAMLERLVGMFAFAIFDRGKRALFIARDRFGEKPLVWAPTPDGVAFASEIKALAGVPGVDLSGDTDAIAEYLARQYVLAPRTAYRGVKSLEPATFGLFVADHEPSLTRYWTPRPAVDLPASPVERQERVSLALDRAIRACSIADVPVGCFLSSGIDSSLVAAGMKASTRSEIETFSIGFAERGYDESGESSELARTLGVKHHVEILARPTFDELQSILQRYDQPFGDSAAIPTFMLSRIARERVKVVLTGDGGDEGFGGYERYRMMLLSGGLPRTELVRRVGRRLLRHGGAAMSAGRIVGRAIIVAASSRFSAYQSLMGPFDAKSIAALFPAHEPLRFEPEERCFDAWDDVTVAAQVADLTTYLPSCLTTKVDIASMAHSLETRAPLLDHRLVELGLALPRSERLQLRRTKVTLRRIAARNVDPGVSRRKKRGFGVPLEVWLRGPMRAEASAYLLGDGACTVRVLERAAVEEEIRAFFDGDRSRYSRVWTLLALEAWLRSPLGGNAIP